MSIPLAERMRPKTLEKYIGQKHVIGQQTPLFSSIEKGRVPSMILWGPPGVGKTTLAYLIAQKADKNLYTISAISSGVKDVRDVIHKVENNGLFNQKGTILFIDEIHRFSKSQQDSLLNAVEKGIITLIGATTENPSFEVIPALLSRCQVYTLESHGKSDLIQLLELAIAEDPFLKTKRINLKETELLLRISGGDARKLLNLFELIITVCADLSEINITNDLVEKNAGSTLAIYDKQGENHYDIISAFIKSIRGSDPNAAIYWLARMIKGGEDPKFIARRLLIAASEDIGLANPTALVIANTTFQSVQSIGWPESRIILSQCAIYLATSPKGNAAYNAINLAQELVRKTGDLAVPLHLRNAPTKLMKELGYGDNYEYAHQYDGNFVYQEFMPENLSNYNLFQAGSSKKEQEIKNQIELLWGKKYPTL
ncbi:MAG: replication-associated recombination protein A [Crocinitomicaceae bacterium]|jgi:putative ATPase